MLSNNDQVIQLIKSSGTVCESKTYSKPPPGRFLVALMTCNKRFTIVVSIENLDNWIFSQSRKNRNALEVEYYLVSVEFAQQHKVNREELWRQETDRLSKQIFG
jgi:hypothetical protein